MTIEAKEHYEHISIIMEIVAFFFVTIDLYGKHRFEKFRNWIKSINPEQSINTKKAIALRILCSIGFSLFIFMLEFLLFRKHMSYTDINKENISTKVVFHAISPHNWADIIMMTTSLVMGWNYKTFFVKIPKKIVIASLHLIIRMSLFFRIEGVMLTIGAILFVIAKLMLYFSI